MTHNVTTLNFVHKRRLIQAERRKRAAITSTHQAAVYGHARQHGVRTKKQVHTSASQNTADEVQILINTSVQQHKHL